MEILFWAWFVFLHCCSVTLLYWWDREKEERADLKAKYIRLTSDIVRLYKKKEEKK